MAPNAGDQDADATLITDQTAVMLIARSHEHGKKKHGSSWKKHGTASKESGPHN